MQNRLLAAALAILLSVAPTLAQQFPSTLPPNTVYGRLGSTAGPGQAIPFAQLPTAGAITSLNGVAITGGTINGAAVSNLTQSGGTIDGAAITGGSMGTTALTSVTIGNSAFTGGTINGAAFTNGTVTGLPSPTDGGDAANKTYVDSFVAGLIVVPQATYATAAVLPNTPTYSNGTLGVGATLTAGSNSTLTVDGTVAALASVVLVKNQASAFQNGIYTVTTAGSGGAAWVLTRATYFDAAAEMAAHSYVFITSGSANANTAWVLQTTVATVGTDTLTWNLYSTAANSWTASGSDVYRAAGNLGLGGAPSAWSNIFEVVQIASGTIARSTSDTLGLYANMYWNGSDYKYINNGTAAAFAINAGGALLAFTAPSGTAGATATTSTRMNLSTTGTFTLGAYGAGVANFNSSGVMSSKTAHTTSVFYAADYGCLPANSAATNNTNCQAAITACIAVSCILQMPAGVIATSAAFTCNGPMIMQGVGMASVGVGVGSTLGTTISSTKTTGTVFSCATYDSVQFRDLTISVATGAATIIDIASANLALTTCNRASRVTNVHTVGGGIGINMHAACNFALEKNFISNASVSGIRVFTADNAITDIGDWTITGNTVWDFPQTATGPAYDLVTSGFGFTGNKSLGHTLGVRSLACGSICGTVLISGNSFEEFSLGCYLVGQNAGGTTFGFVNFSNNQCQTSRAGYQYGITITAGGGYLTQVVIGGNIINMGGTAYSPAGCISINDGDHVNVHDNSCNLNGSTSSIAFSTSNNATNVQFANNMAKGYALARYSCSVAAKVLDPWGGFNSWGNC